MNRKQTSVPNLQLFQRIPVLFTTRIIFPTTLLICLFPASITAQTIIPAQDGHRTQVTPQGNQFNINGGRLSGDGANLFHSFEKLGLSQGEILNFISNPKIQNILGRVTGGEASFINGLIQVTGGNSNLFLINPAGIVFGENASLNIPASFTATTASSIGFGNQNWFQAIGENQWQTLVGTPRDFVFNSENPGSLVNLGNLTVSPGENITLLAGTVLNTGTVSAPGGNITIAAVTGENLVRISQDGHLLNLELTSDIPQTPSPFTPLSLPELLTGGNLGNANQVKVNEQGQVILTASGVAIPTEPGTTILSGAINVSSPTQTGGTLQLAGEKIGLINSILDASGLTGGGTILIGGDYKGLGDFPTSEKTFISSDSFVNANALETGNGGRVIVWSEELTQVYGLIQVRGGIQNGNGGFVETSSRGILEINTAPDIAAPSGLGGTWLLDPNNIDIVDDTGGNTNLNENSLATGELLFNTTDDNARLSVFLLKSALTEGNVIVETGDVENNSQDGNITFQTSLDFDGIGDDRILTLNAAGNIILDGQTISDSNPGDVDQLSLNFNADFDNNNNGSVFVRNAIIDTNGGDFTATGRGNTTFRSGVLFDNSQLNTLGGNITLDGIAVDNLPFNHGILLTNSSLNSANGDVTLTGTSGTQTDTNMGVWLEQSTINSDAGNINIIGNSQGSQTSNIGILLNNNSTLQSTTGNISLIGSSENGLNSFGVNLNQSSILTVDGTIQLTGTPAGSDGSVGIYVSESNIASTGTGIIDLRGNNNATGDNNDGISILNNGLIFSAGTGRINLSGVSGDGNNSEGIYIANGQIQTLDGDILIQGLGRGANTSPGIFIGDGGEIVATGIGNISLDGLSNATGSGSHGISLFGSANITATENINLVGSSSQTTNSQGIFILDGPIIEVLNGNLNLTGVSTADFNGQGILLGNSLLKSSGTGTINLSGTGNGTGGDSNGILLINTAQINSLSSGDINLQGRSAAVPDSEGIGIFQGSQIQTNTGSILIDGVNNGENTTSVIIGENTPITTTGSGRITISGNQNLFISSLTNSGGEINLQSSEGSVNSSFGTLDSSSAVGDGGIVTIDAAGNINIASINSSTTANSGNTQAGSVTLTSANNTVTITNNINASATTGQGNNITISAPVQLTQPTTTFNTAGSTSSGDIIFNNTVNGTLSGSNSLILQAGTGTVSFNDSVGNITPLNGLTVTGGNINSIAPINITTSGLTINASGEVNLADILATDGGIVNILATGNITTQDIITEGETITLTSSNGDINTQNGILESQSTNDNGGNQIINASGTVILGEINTSTASSSTNSQAGTLDITSGNNSISLTGDINTSASEGQGSEVNFNTNVILPQDNVTITTTGNNRSGNVTFNGTVNGGRDNNSGSNSLTLQTGEGDVNFNQAVGDSVPLQTLTINSGNVVTQSTVTVDNGAINITATEDVTFNDTVTTNNNSPVDVVAEGDITTTDIISNGERIALTSNTGNINTTAGILNSSSTTEDGGEINLNAAQNLSVGAINTRTESNLGTSQAGTLTLAGNSITLTNNIDTSATIGSGNNITFNSPVILDADTVTLTTSGTAKSGDVTFNNTVDSNTPGNSNLTLQAGTGTVSVNETIGGTNTLNSLEVNSGDINSNANITVEAGGVNLNSSGTVNLTEPITATNTGTININAENNITTADLTTQGQEINLNSNTGNIDSSSGTLNSSSNNSNGGDVNITTTASVSLGEINTSTQTNQAGTLSVSGETIALTGDINNSGNNGNGSNLTFNNPVEINQPVNINTSGTSGSGNITFNNTVNSIPADNNGLTLQAGTANIQFNNSVTVGGLDITAGSVNSTSPITVNTGDFIINSSDAVTLPQDITTTNSSEVEITATNNIVTGNITTNGQPITLNSSNGNITTNPGTLNTSSENNGGAITINTPGTLNLGGVNTSTNNGQAGTLNINTQNNPIILNNDINTSASNGAGSQQQYNSPVQLASPNITLTSFGTNSSGNISFNFPVNGNSNLTVNAGSGNLTFSTVGDSNPLSSLQVNTTGLTTLQGNLTVNNIVDFSNASGGTQLANNISINTTGNNGDILFNNSPITGSQTLTLNAGSGTISLNTIGNNNNPVSGLIFQQANAVNLFGDIYTASGLDFSSVNTVNIESNSVTLDTSIGNGAINFLGSTLTGQGNLTLNTGNNDVNLDTFNNESPLNGLEITARTVQANAPITVGSGGLNINASNIVNLNANTLSNNTVVITATNDINTRDITVAEGITLNSRNGNITVNSLNTSSSNLNGGDITLNTPQGNITTNSLNSSSPNGQSGDISLSSPTGTVTTGNILTSGLTGGNVTVNAETSITAGQIDTQGQTQAGNVFLDPINDVQVEYINAESANGRGGNVFVESTQGYFRATNSFPTPFSPTGTASISTAGRLGSGSITIRHAGGPLNPPVATFEIGGNLTVNGTAAAITTGDFSILPPQSFEGSFTLGNIAIQTDDAPPNIPPNENPTQGNTGVIIQQNISIPPNSEEKQDKITPEFINNPTNSSFPQELLSTTEVAFQSNNLDSSILLLEQLRNQEFQQHLGVQSNLLNRLEVQQFLKELELKTQQVYAIVYIVSRENQLEIIVVPSSGEPLHHSVPEATREKLFPVVRDLQTEITNPRKRNTVSYQASAQQLYEWMIQPIANDLQKLGVSTILFSLDPGLRSLPIAALWDGQQFLVEKYAISLIPSTSLIDFRYQAIGQAEVLAMGASQFQQQNPLPAVPIELENIINLWPGEEFLNERFTLENLKSQRRLSDFEVIHLATHADFKPGSPSNSYIQLWNEKLPITELPSLNFDNPTVELLTLSACRTALGDRRSELGFAGLAVQAGVKSALASLWYVSDQGTLGLMSEFYQDLRQAPIKAIALQNAQINMIQERTRLENDQLITTFDTIPLPSDLAGSNITTLSHPYYWSGFTMIGSPW
ncbi:putative Filamentous hemagglutinin family outer membrane protein [Planktothrix serta PCC 8927]|uniref:Filamentous hemagglutinin family outer membrane protein n=1 Tax=Planktothrix serta PCC 8927 TaxID=671068 RepID=A0A7Z9E250_9CYAN|nr:CHAT domain-containing protein [Planktothrix serta]VXD23536.1 putative Filamentous hemagglutinin family outer membrane protein [Planktothrix serta PCC 8927]